ncbi:hypothetical protein F5Y18DRAFT_156047 [Xylariaceae sp. FL1019]|nr:hypothetical protein F5Y18DRAFT_156047 [Xylariaceae sp. FL1019]
MEYLVRTSVKFCVLLVMLARRPYKYLAALAPGQVRPLYFISRLEKEILLASFHFTTQPVISSMVFEGDDEFTFLFSFAIGLFCLTILAHCTLYHGGRHWRCISSVFRHQHFRSSSKLVISTSYTHIPSISLSMMRFSLEAVYDSLNEYDLSNHHSLFYP